MCCLTNAYGFSTNWSPFARHRFAMRLNDVPGNQAGRWRTASRHVDASVSVVHCRSGGPEPGVGREGRTEGKNIDEPRAGVDRERELDQDVVREVDERIRALGFDRVSVRHLQDNRTSHSE